MSTLVIIELRKYLLSLDLDMGVTCPNAYVFIDLITQSKDKKIHLAAHNYLYK